eukprot:7388132-Prymnesium_polylepis.1
MSDSFESKLAERMAASRLMARRYTTDCVVSALDYQVQDEILGLIGLEGAAAAAQVCSTWSNLLRDDLLWRRLVYAADPIAADAAADAAAADAAASEAGGSSAPASVNGSASGSGSLTHCGANWRSMGQWMRAREVALQKRWRSGTFVEHALRTLHADYIMALLLHDGLLVTASADSTIGLTDVASVRTSSAKVGDGTKELRGHRGQVQAIHACGDQLASCSTEGQVLIWSLADRSVQARHRLGTVYSLHLDGHQLTCGADALTPVSVYDVRDGTLTFEAPDDQPPSGVTTCLQRTGGRLAAGNSDTHSQLRVWDLAAGEMVDRFCLPPYCKG